MTTFYTADTHFGHAGCLSQKFCNRPFKTVAEMNVMLVKRWNKLVQPGDTVYHLGDFATEDMPRSIVKGWFDRLNGRKILVAGNHDREATLSLPWHAVHRMTVDVETARGNVFRLCHYPVASKVSGVVLHGHLHTLNRGSMMPTFDVGVDGNNFYPWSEQELDRLASSWKRGMALLEGLQRSAVS